MVDVLSNRPFCNNLMISSEGKKSRWLVYMYIRYTFSSNHNVHKSLHGHSFLASNPLIDIVYLNLSIKGSKAQKQRPHKLLWMLWFDEKSTSNIKTYSSLSVIYIIAEVHTVIFVASLLDLQPFVIIRCTSIICIYVQADDQTHQFVLLQ